MGFEKKILFNLNFFFLQEENVYLSVLLRVMLKTLIVLLIWDN